MKNDNKSSHIIAKRSQSPYQMFRSEVVALPRYGKIFFVLFKCPVWSRLTAIGGFHLNATLELDTWMRHSMRRTKKKRETNKRLISIICFICTHWFQTNFKEIPFSIMTHVFMPLDDLTQYHLCFIHLTIFMFLAIFLLLFFRSFEFAVNARKLLIAYWRVSIGSLCNKWQKKNKAHCMHFVFGIR